MRRMMLLIAILGCKEPPPNKAPAPTPAPAPGDAAPKQLALADELEQLRAKHKFPALAAAAWRDGKLVEIAAVGVRKVDDPASKVTTNDLWHLGSNTKAMTATLIGIYVDRGVLRWDDTIAKLFKGYKIDPGYAKVTLDQLLQHKGGAPGMPPAKIWKQLWDDGAAPDARAKLVKSVLASPPSQAPGTFEYSNAGYMIAGAALEKATGKRWEDLIREELFAKLGMTACGFGPPGRKDAVEQPWGHDAGGTPIAPGPAADNPAGLGPAGTVHCSLDSYGKFLSMHATGTPALVKPETLAHLHDAPMQGYVGGWLVIADARGKALVHGGSNTLWYALTTVVPSEKLAIAVVTNTGDEAFDAVMEPLLRRYASAK